MTSAPVVIQINGTACDHAIRGIDKGERRIRVRTEPAMATPRITASSPGRSPPSVSSPTIRSRGHQGAIAEPNSPFRQFRSLIDRPRPGYHPLGASPKSGVTRYIDHLA